MQTCNSINFKYNKKERLREREREKEEEKDLISKQRDNNHTDILIVKELQTQLNEQF